MRLNEPFFHAFNPHLKTRAMEIPNHPVSSGATDSLPSDITTIPGASVVSVSGLQAVPTTGYEIEDLVGNTHLVVDTEGLLGYNLTCGVTPDETAPIFAAVICEPRSIVEIHEQKTAHNKCAWPKLPPLVYDCNE
jgi:hypothetical protein